MISAPTIDQLNSEAWELRLSQQARCLELSQQALEQAQQAGYELGMGYAWRNLGFVHYQTAEYADAVQFLRKGLEIGRKHKEHILGRDCLNFLGAVLAVQGDVGTALSYVEQTLEINQKLDDQRGVATALDNMGYLYHRLGQDDQAVKVRTEALRLSREIGNAVREAYVLVNLSANYLELGQFAQAIALAREGLVLSRVHNLEQLQPIGLQNLGEALAATGQHIEAMLVLQQSLELAERLELRQTVVQSWHNMAVVHLQLKQNQAALDLLTQAIQEAGQLGISEVQSELHQRLSECYESLGQFENALYHHRCFYLLERAIREGQAEQRLRILSVQRELEKTKSEADLAQIKNVELAQALAAREQADREKTVLLKELEMQVTQDALTHVHNRRYLETVLAQEFERASKNQHLLPVVMLDVDNFKGVNDNFSHLTGDKVLQTVAQILKSSARITDIVARYGGEEFVLVLPRASLEQAIQVCERVRFAIEQYPWSLLHPDLKVTVSMGLASDTTLPNHEKLLDTADRKLYQAKRAGKNRLVH